VSKDIAGAPKTRTYFLHLTRVDVIQHDHMMDII